MFASIEAELSTVPAATDQLATPLGTLMQDASHSADSLLKPLHQLCVSAADMCISNYKSSFADLMLFLTRATVRVCRVFHFVLKEGNSIHMSIHMPKHMSIHVCRHMSVHMSIL